MDNKRFYENVDAENGNTKEHSKMKEIAQDEV